MKTWLRIAVVAAFLVEGVAFAQQADILTPENAIPNQFIVVLHEEAPTAAPASTAADTTAERGIAPEPDIAPEPTVPAPASEPEVVAEIGRAHV